MKTFASLPFTSGEVVQLLRWVIEKSCNALPRAGGSEAVAAGEGFSRSQKSKLPATRITLSGTEGPTLPEGE